ncbi:MAG TPA: SagB/ThcOx family dehydrogenase [Candidatus Nanoarchaeia archaeon]|nr:SagB/ThcOx family dehydrogenase [Candidatus Nanoarchaeia archaeon]
MLEAIRQFYKYIRNKELITSLDDAPPITLTKIFHKKYPRLKSVPLPDVERTESQLETLLEIRKSTRKFTSAQLSMVEISKILGSCRITDSKREPEKRTYPSGGARFPVELYLFAYRIEGLSRGAYHYNIVDGALEILIEEDLRQRIREFISPFLENPAATIVFTSVLARAEVKYGARAYPYSLIEAGYMGQNIELACAEIGVGSCPVSGFIDDSIKEVLDLTEDEIPIHTISIGRG